VDLSLDSEFSGAGVQIIPLEGADLTSAQAGGEFQQKNFIAAILFGLDQQPLNLLRSQHLHLSGLGGRDLAVISRIAEEEFLCDSFVQRGVERCVYAPDCLVGQALTVELCPDESAALFELGIELLNVVGGQFVHLNISQHRDDVLINAPLIGHLCIGPEIGLLVALIPKVQPIT